MQNILWTKNKVKVIVVLNLFYFDTLLLFAVHAHRNRKKAFQQSAYRPLSCSGGEGGSALLIYIQTPFPPGADPLPPGHVTCDACWESNPLPPLTDKHL